MVSPTDSIMCAISLSFLSAYITQKCSPNSRRAFAKTEEYKVCFCPLLAASGRKESS